MELSKDLYAAAKKSLARLLKRRSHEAKILVIRFKLFVGKREIQAEIFLSNPTIDEIRKLFELQRSDIEDAFKPLVSQKEVVKVAADLTKHGLVPRFALRRDGVPFDSGGRLIAYKGGFQTASPYRFGTNPPKAEILKRR